MTEPDPSGTHPRDGNSRGLGRRVIDWLAGEVFGAGTGGRTALLWGALTLAAWAFAVSPGGAPVGRVASGVAGVLLVGLLGRAIYLLFSDSPHRD